MGNALIVDHNSLAYAWEAGGKNLLDELHNYAKLSNHSLVITDVVYEEIKLGPKGPEMISWLNANNIWPVSSNEMELYKSYLREEGGLTAMVIKHCIKNHKQNIGQSNV